MRRLDVRRLEELDERHVLEQQHQHAADDAAHQAQQEHIDEVHYRDSSGWVFCGWACEYLAECLRSIYHRECTRGCLLPPTTMVYEMPLVLCANDCVYVCMSVRVWVCFAHAEKGSDVMRKPHTQTQVVDIRPVLSISQQMRADIDFGCTLPLLFFLRFALILCGLKAPNWGSRDWRKRVYTNAHTQHENLKQTKKAAGSRKV